MQVFGETVSMVPPILLTPGEPSSQWYGRQGAIDHWFCGVFEGGGAKGVAYAGALRAMRDCGCWFVSVAGSSAGAISAALIAAGLTPEEISEATPDALRRIQTPLWAGLSRLQSETGFFRSHALREWLEALLTKRLGRSSKASEGRVTFRELYEATRIELNVVAADLSLRRQMIFSVWDTPNCSVADAVVASSSIPFAFSSNLLSVRDPDGGASVVHHTIVDGGVWSNFPMFIYEDRAFREYYERSPAVIDRGNVLGFLLKEQDDEPPPRGEDIGFAEVKNYDEVRAREWRTLGQNGQTTRIAGWPALGAWALSPLGFLGRVAEWNGRMERGRWPDPPRGWKREVWSAFSGLLGGMHPWLFAFGVWLFVAYGAWEISRDATVGMLRSMEGWEWSELGTYSLLVGPIFVVFLDIMAILVVATAAVGVLANRVLLRATRRIGWGLVSTFAAGPGAPAWATRKRNIVELPIPHGISSLSFGMSDSQRNTLEAAASTSTRSRLADIIAARLGHSVR